MGRAVGMCGESSTTSEAGTDPAYTIQADGIVIKLLEAAAATVDFCANSIERAR